MTKDIYQKSHWDKYSDSFNAILSPPQIALYKEVAQTLSGNVLDCGCGNANLAAFINSNVASYEGIDAAIEMVNKSKENFNKLATSSRLQAYHCLAETFVGEQQYDQITFVNSLYAMESPLTIFKHMYNLLAPDGKLIIANPNELMTTEHMEKMINLYEHLFSDKKEVKEFISMNLQFVETYQQQFYSLTKLQDWLNQANFKVVCTDQSHFHGAMNLVVATK